MKNHKLIIILNEMLKPIDIFLWTLSLVISFASLLFAILATYFSNKTNNQMRNFIEKTWIIQEARGIFMNQLKTIERENSRAIEVLKSVKYRFWNKYFYSIINTRLAPISQISKQILNNTDYSELVVEYEKIKKELDGRFRDLVDFSNLNDHNTNMIDPIKAQELIKYHVAVKNEVKKIITRFTQISEAQK